MNPAAVSADQLEDGDEGPALLDQEFIRDSSKTIGDRINEVVASAKERIEVARFVRWQLGE